MSEKKAKEAKKAAPVINWRVAADRAVIGEKTELKSLPGYWVQPCRISKQGEAEITASVARRQIKKSAIRRSFMSGMDTSVLSEADRLAGVIPDEMKEKIMEAVTENMDVEDLAPLEGKVLRIAFGIHAHNFENPDGGPASKEWANSLTPYTDVFDEILELVEAKNRPLSRATSPISETLLTGSTTEPSSTRTAGTSKA